MHDFDRQQLEHAYEDELFEGTGAPPGELDGGSELETATEVELAAEVLELASEEELEEFLGKLARRTQRAIGQAHVNNPQALRRTVDFAAKAAGFLPNAVAWMSGARLPPDPNRSPAIEAGARHLLAPLGDAVGRTFGRWAQIEPEGMSDEDRELELARRYVRFTHRAMANAMRAPRRLPPQRASRIAVHDAARAHLPGMVPHITQVLQLGGMTVPASGRWYRDRGRLVIDLG